MISLKGLLSFFSQYRRLEHKPQHQQSLSAFILEPILTPSGLVDDTIIGLDSILLDSLHLPSTDVNSSHLSSADNLDLALATKDLAVDPLSHINTANSSNIEHIFESGIFTVGESGKVSIDFLFDSGGYQGELAVFSLRNMEQYLPGSHEFISEAARRALDNSDWGHIIISDQNEGARFSGIMPGEWENHNIDADTYQGVKTFTMRTGDTFGIMLVPNGTVQQLLDNPSAEGALHPLFSLTTANPNEAFHLGQIADVTGDGNTFVMEDLRVDTGSDRDYNDIIFQVRGATGIAVHLDEVINPNLEWRGTEIGQALLAYAEPYNHIPTDAHPVANDSPGIDPLPTVNSQLISFDFPESSQSLVGIIDTGFSYDNPDIDYSHITLGHDYVDGDNNPLLHAGEGDEHGTHILGIIGATQNNELGIDGINDSAPIWLGRATGSEHWADSLVEFVNASRESGQPHAIVNLSFDLTHINPDGSVTTHSELTPDEWQALDYAHQNHVLIVVPTGDDGHTISALGQASRVFDNIITVGAAENINPSVPANLGFERADYSNYGNSLDIVAIGGTQDNPILSTVGNTTGEVYGTAAASAQVTGAASQVWAANPHLSYRQVIDILKLTATDLTTPNWDAETGAGLLNIAAAVHLAQATEPNTEFPQSIAIAPSKTSPPDPNPDTPQAPPSILFNPGGYLTEPSDAPPLNIALDFVRQNATRLGVTAADVADLNITDNYVTDGTGASQIYLQQRINGLELFNSSLSITIASDGRVLSAGNRFTNNLATRANSTVPQIDAAEAVSSIAANLGLSFETPPTAVSNIGGTAQEAVFSGGSVSHQDIPVRLMYDVAENGEIRLVWHAVIDATNSSGWQEINIDANTGEVLRTVSWESDASYNVYANPVESPADGSRTTQVNPADPLASPFGWHDTNGLVGAEYTDTRGNNVYAQEDQDNNDTGGYRPNGGASLDFNFPLNLSQDPTTYQNASITNLFYWNNVLHDIHYHYGFNEAAGNFQQNNYSRGGTGGDAVQADALDGSFPGRNNANFGTPPDGQNPRMQMYMWDYTPIRRDSSLDNGIIIHEYGHGVSTRLTGGPSNSGGLNALQSGGMGEGWGDFWAVALTMKPTDTRNGRYSMGTYVLGQPTDGLGIRHYPYSTDMSVNPLTYGNVRFNPEEHAMGEIWAVTLLDLYWNLVDVYGFDSNIYTGTGGNNKMLQLVMDGLKIQPANPSFLDARDAILAADQLRNGGANQALIWQTFARRGMGYSAYAGTSSNSTNVIEAFDLPPSLRRISGNQTVSNTLSTTDRNNPTRSGRFTDEYLLNTLPAGERVRVRMTSGFDNYLQLINATTGQVIAYNDDTNGLNAELTFTVDPNIRYLIRATSYASGATGNYSLTTSPVATTILGNQTVNTTLSTTDPNNPQRSGRFADDYLLTGVSPGQQVRVNMTSAGFDNYLQLLNAATRQIIAYNDDTSGLNAELTFTAQAGIDYLIRATSYGSGATGNYTLNTTSATPITSNQSVSANLSTTDPNNSQRNGSFADDYRLTGVGVGQQVQVNMNSAFDNYLQLINGTTGQVIAYNDDTNGLNAQLTFTTQAGIDYLIRATSYASGATGDYTLTTRPGATPITSNQSVSANLSTTDPNNSQRNGSFADDYRLTGVGVGQQVQVNMNSAFDNYLQLINGTTGQVIAYNDDTNGLNAQLAFTTQAGIDYLIRATSYASGATGDYTLTTRPGATPITSNQSVSANLSTTDPNNSQRNGSFADDYRLTGVGVGQQVQVNMNSAFDNYLQLINGTTGQVIAYNDDTNGLNAQLAFTTQAGIDYLIRATSYASGATGDYTLTTHPGATPITSNQSVSANLSTTDPNNSQRNGSFADDYRLTGVGVGQQVQVNMNSAFDNYLQLINGTTGQVIAYNDDTNGLNAQLAFTTQAGIDYLIRATSYASGVTGNYTLTAVS